MKVSIIVPNLNYAIYLPACLNSIAAQTYKNIEVLLADGGSTDGSLEIIKDYADRYRWIIFSTKDKGQVDVLNRGLALATGEIQCWLNSDDIFLSNKAVEIAVSKFQELGDVDIISLGGYYLNENGRYLNPIKLHYHPLLRQSSLLFRWCAFVQPATFWKKEVFTTIKLDPSFFYSFDSDFFMEALAKFNILIDQNCYIAGYRLHDKNISLNFNSERVIELSRLNEKHLGKGFRTYYLRVLGFVVQLIQYCPQPLAYKLTKIIYFINNMMSYYTIHRIPSV